MDLDQIREYQFSLLYVFMTHMIVSYHDHRMSHYIPDL